MKKDKETINLQDFLIINTPAFLFLLLIPAAIVSSHYHSIIRYAAIPFFIWGISGCFLLLADYYNRKKKLFIRLLRLNTNRDPLKHSLYLKSTVCGLAILWALYARKKNYYRSDTL